MFLGQFLKINLIYGAICISIQNFVFIDAYWRYLPLFINSRHVANTVISTMQHND